MVIRRQRQEFSRVVANQGFSRWDGTGDMAWGRMGDLFHVASLRCHHRPYCTIAFREQLNKRSMLNVFDYIIQRK